MEARRERIAALALSLLPSFQTYQRKRRLADIIITVSVVGYAILGGYLYNEFNRCIDYGEFAALNSVIDAAASKKGISISELTNKMLSHYGLSSLHEMKARNWSDALQYAATAR